MAITASAVPAGFVDLALEGCTVVVTGAGSGIGAATARLLGAAGASVVLVGRREALLRQSAGAIEETGGHAVLVPADLADPSSPARIIAAALAAFGLRLSGQSVYGMTKSALDYLTQSLARQALKVGRDS